MQERIMSRKIVFASVFLSGILCCSVYADCKYYRYSDHSQMFYTENGYICRYQDHKRLYYLENGYIVRYSDHRRMFYMEDNYVVRSSDHKRLYYFENSEEW